MSRRRKQADRTFWANTDSTKILHFKSRQTARWYFTLSLSATFICHHFNRNWICNHIEEVEINISELITLSGQLKLFKNQTSFFAIIYQVPWLIAKKGFDYGCWKFSQLVSVGQWFSWYETLTSLALCPYPQIVSRHRKPITECR